MKFVSPTAKKWHEIHQNLFKFWEDVLNQMVDQPPKPLILAGWCFSNDFDKRFRWEETTAWAKRFSCTHLITELKDDEMYVVNQFSRWIPNQYSNRNEKPREKPTIEQLDDSLAILKESWSRILSHEFGENTQPFKFTGNKKRRFVVRYGSKYLPPWGSWTDHLANGLPSLFTQLRKNINKLISPHEIDHIDFEPLKRE